MIRKLFLFLLLIILGACLDRLTYDTPKVTTYEIAIDGLISDQPGPYRVNINHTYDIESRESIKSPVSAEHVIISDNFGGSEELKEVSVGTYETSATGIRGQVGRVYKVSIQLPDGRVYESVPDTLTPPGKMDSLYYSFTSTLNAEGVAVYGFDIFANASHGMNRTNRFMWGMTGTFKSLTHPEFQNLECFYLEDRCNYAPACSGLKNIGTSANKSLVRVAPCTCCICWYEIYNIKPILSDDNFNGSGKYDNLYIYSIPLSPWIFMYKIHVKVNQLSLTNNSFNFFKAIRDQKNATGSIFQPITGKIPSGFVQINGAKSSVHGLFFATAISSTAVFIERSEIVDKSLIPSIDAPGIGWFSCLEAFPNATTVKPLFWVD